MSLINRAILLRYLFIVGVLVTGILIERTLSGLAHVTILSFGLLAAAVWLVYYQLVLASRFERFEDE